MITEGHFGGSTAFDTFEVAYTLPPPAPPPLNLPVVSTLAAAQQTQRHIDVRVYWYGQVNTYLDQVVLEDFVDDPANPHYNGAYQLFRDQRILTTAGMQGSANGRGRGITATPNPMNEMWSSSASSAMPGAMN